jgi:hypothetical protein
MILASRGHFIFAAEFWQVFEKLASFREIFKYSQVLAKFLLWLESKRVLVSF